jgi:hypothetical protein
LPTWRERLQSAAGYAVVRHDRRNDFVELLQFTLLNTMDYYDYLNLGFKLTAAAGSDVPWGSTIGEVRTYVYTGEKLDMDAWFAGLKAGNTFVSNGPAIEFTVDGKLPGTELTKSAGETVHVKARAWGHPKVGLPRALTIVSNEGVVREILNGPHLPWNWTCRSQSRWLVASTCATTTRCAHDASVRPG